VVALAATPSPPIATGPARLARVSAPVASATATPPPIVARVVVTPPPTAAPRQAATATATPRPRPTAPVPALSLEPEGLVRPGVAASAPTPAPAPTPAEPTEIVIYHEVRPGDTLVTIARRYGVSVDSLLAINEVITDRDVLKVGLKLYVPTKEGVLYFVRKGDTVTEIAEKFKVKPEDIVNFAPNRIPNADSIREGELILVPGGKRPPPPPPPPPVAVPTPARAVVATAVTAAPGAVRPPVAATPAPAPPRPAGSGWAWPISGRISSYFGPSHPLGIDIDLYGRGGAPIAAARGGTVVFAGGNPCCSYGYYVEIDHGDGFRTLYAHLNGPPPVRLGQTVAQGQVIGYAGSSGYSTGVHLHFEIRRSGAPVNPLAYLP
jgi:murein DD-endopeptidase MepM/ murein hydrolase activator NlpD